MTEKEKVYFEKYGKEYLTLRESCEIWRKPGYSTLSKILPKIGYREGVRRGLIPKYRFISGSYLFKISHILDFLNAHEENVNG
jgi:hypothetical protein